MLQEIWNDLQASIANTFKTDGLLALVLMMGIALYMGLRMSKLTQFFSRSLIAIFILGGTLFIINGLTSAAPFSLTQWNNHGSHSWNQVMAMSVQNLMGYVGCFAVLILGVHSIKKLAQR